MKKFFCIYTYRVSEISMLKIWEQSIDRDWTNVVFADETTLR